MNANMQFTAVLLASLVTAARGLTSACHTRSQAMQHMHANREMLQLSKHLASLLKCTFAKGRGSPCILLLLEKQAKRPAHADVTRNHDM
jgi:hypothetical protein